ncbi:hypothetical protein [Roseibium sp.]|uniref:hypothetical protein n=1 Tax=Roseibium sp. TaxID=1936156 RepID=UPI003B519A8C
MSDLEKDGGAAFAAAAGTATDMDIQKGMSLRDWFAGQALTGIGTWIVGDDPSGKLASEAELNQRAHWAYRQADAMLRAREE